MDESKPRPAPLFAHVGRPEVQRGDVTSRSMLLFISVGLFAALLSLLWELGPARGVWSLRPVEVTYMTDELRAAQAVPPLEAGDD
jgi:hypothetical protein